MTWAARDTETLDLTVMDTLSVCFLQDIVSRHLAERSATEDQMPRLGPAVWAAGSQSELTPSESLTTSDAVRETLLLPSMAFSHFFFLLSLASMSLWSF